nr:copper resistance protein CopC [uncultured Duganella sp.]
MRRLQSLIYGAILGVAALANAPAMAHATIQVSEPAANAELAKAPPAIALTFNEDVEPAFSSIVLQDATGKAVPEVGKAAVDATNKRLLKLDLPPLKSGGYIVRWVAVGPDGHRRNGQYNFSVK